MIKKLLAIDELTLDAHTYLSSIDKCFYLMNYHARMGSAHSEENQLMINFKKPLRLKGGASWKYKISAIEEVSGLFSQVVIPAIPSENYTLVPIPPSKHKSNPEYDDRMMQVLAGSCPPHYDVRDLLSFAQDMPASHESQTRPTIEDLSNHLIVNTSLLEGIKPNVILIDDMITTGAHYQACKRVLNEAVPNLTFYGVFIARRDVDLEDLF